MGKSVIYAGNSTSQATTVAGTIIQFPTIVRRYGHIGIDNANVSFSEQGYYNGNVNLTIGGTADGTATAQVYENGVPIPFATANVRTSATSSTNVVIPFVVRSTCGCQQKTITVVVSGVVANVTNAGIVLEKE